MNVNIEEEKWEKSVMKIGRFQQDVPKKWKKPNKSIMQFNNIIFNDIGI